MGRKEPTKSQLCPLESAVGSHNADELQYRKSSDYTLEASYQANFFYYSIYLPAERHLLLKKEF